MDIAACRVPTGMRQAAGFCPAHLAKLERIGHPLLRQSAASLREKRLAAYQENLLADVLLEN